MSTSPKKRKLQHSTDRPGAPAHGVRKSRRPGAASPPEADARFQINSDFTDSEDDAGVDPAKNAIARALSGKHTPKQELAKVLSRNLVRGFQQPESDPGADDGTGAGPGPEVNGKASARARTQTAKLRGESEDEVEDEATDRHGLGSGEVDEDGGDEVAARRGSGRAAGSSGGASDGDEDGDGGGAKPNVLEHRDGEQQQELQLQGKQNKKVLTKRKLERVKEASERRGIVYISRIPPHMKPHKLRQLLGPFGDLGRVYCAPEDPALRRMRKKKGGNSGKNFTEGWVEFEDKRRAKRAALALNGQPMGGSKRSAYYYDLWNIKYLPKFKWDTLTEEINYQRAVREQRLVAEISAAKRERDFYLSRVDKAKAIDAMQERRAKKQKQQPQPETQAEGAGGQARPGAAPGGDASGSAAASTGAAEGGGSRRGPPPLERHYGQRRAKADPVLDEQAPVLADDVLGLLGGRKKRQPQQQGGAGRERR